MACEFLPRSKTSYRNLMYNNNVFITPSDVMFPSLYKYIRQGEKLLYFSGGYILKYVSQNLICYDAHSQAVRFIIENQSKSKK